MSSFVSVCFLTATICYIYNKLHTYHKKSHNPQPCSPSCSFSRLAVAKSKHDCWERRKWDYSIFYFQWQWPLQMQIHQKNYSLFGVPNKSAWHAAILYLLNAQMHTDTFSTTRKLIVPWKVVYRERHTAETEALCTLSQSVDAHFSSALPPGTPIHGTFCIHLSNQLVLPPSTHSQSCI